MAGFIALAVQVEEFSKQANRDAEVLVDNNQYFGYIFSIAASYQGSLASYLRLITVSIATNMLGSQ